MASESTKDLPTPSSTAITSDDQCSRLGSRGSPNVGSRSKVPCSLMPGSARTEFVRLPNEMATDGPVGLDRNALVSVAIEPVTCALAAPAVIAATNAVKRLWRMRPFQD